MTYLSRPDRRAETEPAEERRVEVTAERMESYNPTARCPRCGQPGYRHPFGTWEECQRIHAVEIRRRADGPVRVRDMAGGRL